MSPQINTGEGADSSDEDSFVSASAVSPVVSRGPPPPAAPKPASRAGSVMIPSTAPLKPAVKPKPDLGPKPTIPAAGVPRAIRNISGPSTRASAVAAPPGGPNANLAAVQAREGTRAPMSGLARSQSVTRTPSATQSPSSSGRVAAMQPMPTIRLAPVSRSHFANNPLVAGEAQAQAAQGQLQQSNRMLAANPTKVVSSERFVASSPQRTESRRYTTPPAGGASQVVTNERLGHGQMNSLSTQPIPIRSNSTRPQLSRPLSQGRTRNSYDPSIYSPVPSLGMSVDNLANAMVAGALATSAASSRSASYGPPRPSSAGGARRPPAPPPARRSGTSLFDKLTPNHSRHGSRAGSPSKDGGGKRMMKMTLRKEKTGSDEEEDGRHGRHRKRNLVKKHPNKHHEGDRKRWRDVVTERERKRYEGLWAANKNLCIGPPVKTLGRWAEPSESTLSLARFNTLPVAQPGQGGSLYGGTQQRSRPTSRGDGTQGSIPGMQLSYQPAGLGPAYANPPRPPSVGGVQGPYSNSMQNFSTQSFATSGSTSGNNSSPQRPPPSRSIQLPSQTTSPLDPKECVSSLVVRDIWSRSRLPADVLREVWELVDRSGTGMLGKDEFCAGVWLLDQKLKGRKLPQRVGASVWTSVGGIRGVRVREFRGKARVGGRGVEGGG